MVVILVLLTGCDDFAAKVDYRGHWLLSEQPLRVRTVFWPPSGPMAFAMERTDEGSVLHLVPLSGKPPCRTALVSRFAAFVADGELSVGLWHGPSGRVRFFDEACNRWEPDIRDVDDLVLRSGRSGHRFLLSTERGELFLVHPDARTQVRLATGLQRLGGGLYRVGDRDALWVQADGHLGLIDDQGREIGPGFDDVRYFASYSGAGSDLADHTYLAVQQARSVRLLDVTDWVSGGSQRADLVWQDDDACGARFDVVTASCLPDVCDDEDPEVRTASGLLQVPWVSYYSPCDSETLVLRPDADGPAWRVVEGVDSYRVFGLAKDGLPVVAYRLADEPVQDYVHVLGDEPQGLGLPVELDSLSMLGTAPNLVFVSEEDVPRFLYWIPGAPEPRVVLAAVQAPSVDGLALHEFEGGVGQLSLCLVPNCIPVADAVLPGQYAGYETVERVGDPLRLFAYIGNADGELGTGILTVMNRATGDTLDVAEGVSDFAHVEFGAARGLIYTVPSGPNQGLWFAPR